MNKLTATITQDVQVEDVIRIAEAAGAAILNVYSSEDWAVEHKADASPLTRADKEANEIICAGLARITPHIPIVSEESRAVDFEVRKNYQYSWCVDPLDGTKEFLKRNGQFTVNIALLQRGRPVLGVVQVPVQGLVYFAVKASAGQAGLTVVGSASHMTLETTEFLKDYVDPKFEQLGSSLKLLLVAEGKAHVYPRLAPTCEWDTAAADIIVEEAGGVVLQAGRCDGTGRALEDWRAALAQAEPLAYNKPDPLNPFFVVYGRRTD